MKKKNAVASNNDGVSEWLSLLNEPTKNIIKHICQCQRTVGFEYAEKLVPMLPPDAEKKGYGLESFLLQRDSHVEAGFVTKINGKQEYFKEFPFYTDGVKAVYRIMPKDFEAVACELNM